MRYTQPGKKPASKAPSNTRHMVSEIQLLTKPCPIMTAPHDKAMKESQLALPTFLRTRLDGSSSRKYVGKNITKTIVYRSPMKSFRSLSIPATRALDT